MTTTMQATTRTFNLNGRTVPVRTLDDARRLWLDLRDTEGLGASDMVKGCGRYMQDGVCVATVSYNGRMWSVDGSEIA